MYRSIKKNRPYHPPCSTALVSDEHEPRDSVNSPTAFALNSGVHPAPFAMAPSSPIEPGEIRNKNSSYHITLEHASALPPPYRKSVAGILAHLPQAALLSA